MICDLNGSLGSRQFLNVVNERTCFTSRACAFKSSRLFTVSKLYFTRLTVKEHTLDSKYIIYTRGRKSADRYRYRYKVQKFTYRNILPSKEKKN